MNHSARIHVKQLILFFSCFFIMLSAYPANGTPGIIDLRDHNFHVDQKVELEGQWEFYWKELFSPVQLDKDPKPDYYTELAELWYNHDQLEFAFSEYGYATYHVKVLVDKNKLPQMAINMPASYCSYRLWIDGEVFLENGVVAKNKENYEPHWLPISKTFTPQSDTLDLVMQVANFDHYHGGMRQNIELGSAESIFRHREVMIGLDLLLVGILLTATIFFFALYIMGRRKENELLFFALFCFVFIYRVIGVDKLYYLHTVFPDINWRITIHIEYFSLYLSVYIFTRFMRSLYPNETNDIVIKTVSWLSILYVGFVIFTPVWFFTWASQYYLIVLLLFALYAFYVYTKGLIDKRPGASFALVSAVILGISVWFSILSFFKVIDSSPLYFSLGFLGFIFFQALILTFRFSDSLHRAKELAEQGAESKSQFLATMSHEIRTPLNGVMGMSDLLENTKLNNIQKEYLSTIKISGENLLNVINDILDFSKFESGNLSIDNVETNIYELMDDVLAITSTLANEKGLELFYVIDKKVPEHIWIDEGRLKQVLVNLINNALKFTEQGYVFINISVNEVSENNYDLKFEVKDTGIGIPESKRTKLFKAFSQVDSGTARRYGGTGLGLAICKQIVQLMEGDIGVDSEVGEGSTFYFNIKTHKIDTSSYFKQFNFQDKKIGFVLAYKDLMDVVLNFYKKNFELDIHSGISIESVRNGESDSFDALILDIGLLNDHEELKKLIENRKTNQPLIILARPLDDLKFIHQYDLLRIVNKPIRNTILMEQLRELFSLSDVQSSSESSPEDIPDNKIAKESSDYSNVKILLAEDNRINQKVMEKMIEQLGIDIDIAEDGEMAIQAAKDNSYDLIFMDMQMPKMDGLEATREIRKMKLQNEPYIVALTANVLGEDIQKCLDAGMDEYLAKPIKIESLKRLFAKMF